MSMVFKHLHLVFSRAILEHKSSTVDSKFVSADPWSFVTVGLVKPHALVDSCDGRVQS
jgi:hypothetical protein